MVMDENYLIHKMLGRKKRYHKSGLGIFFAAFGAVIISILGK